jgi:hypothetical protein
MLAASAIAIGLSRSALNFDPAKTQVIDRGQVGMFMPIGTLPDGNAARKNQKS